MNIVFYTSTYSLESISNILSIDSFQNQRFNTKIAIYIKDNLDSFLAV